MMGNRDRVVQVDGTVRRVRWNDAADCFALTGKIVNVEARLGNKVQVRVRKEVDISSEIPEFEEFEETAMVLVASGCSNGKVCCCMSMLHESQSVVIISSDRQICSGVHQ